LSERVLILTPVKQAAAHIDRYLTCLAKLEYPADRLSLGLLESDSTDGTYDLLRERLPTLESRYARVTLLKRDFGFQIPAGMPRWAAPFQLSRRVVLAKSRNCLLFGALADEGWVLWLDVDVIDYPPDVLERLLVIGKDIVTPHCVKQYGAKRSTGTLGAKMGGCGWMPCATALSWCAWTRSAGRCCSCAPTCIARG
jgi:GT2 family glycosyltransferase